MNPTKISNKVSTLLLSMLFSFGLAPFTQAQAVSDFAGRWDTTYGEMDFTVRDGGIYAPYRTDNGRVFFQPEGHQLVGYWIEDDSGQRCDSEKDGSVHWGRLVLTFNDDLTSFTGWWSYCNSDTQLGEWVGTRIGAPPAPAEPEWQVAEWKKYRIIPGLVDYQPGLWVQTIAFYDDGDEAFLQVSRDRIEPKGTTVTEGWNFVGVEDVTETQHAVGADEIESLRDRAAWWTGEDAFEEEQFMDRIVEALEKDVWPALDHTGWPTAPEGFGEDGLGLTGLWLAYAEGHGQSAAKIWQLTHLVAEGQLRFRIYPRSIPNMPRTTNDVQGFGDLVYVFDPDTYPIQDGGLTIHSRLGSYYGGEHHLVLGWSDWNTVNGSYTNENPNAVDPNVQQRKTYALELVRVVPELTQVTQTKYLSSIDRLQEQEHLKPEINVTEHWAKKWDTEGDFDGTWLVLKGEYLPPHGDAYPYMLRFTDPKVKAETRYVSDSLMVVRLRIARDATLGKKSALIMGRRFDDILELAQGPAPTVAVTDTSAATDEVPPSDSPKTERAPMRIALVGDGGAKTGEDPSHDAGIADKMGSWLYSKGYVVYRYSAHTKRTDKFFKGTPITIIGKRASDRNNGPFLKSVRSYANYFKKLGEPEEGCCDELFIYLRAHGNLEGISFETPDQGVLEDVWFANGGKRQTSLLEALGHMPSWVNVTIFVDACGSGGLIEKIKSSNLCNGLCGLTVVTTAGIGCRAIGNPYFVDSSTEDFIKAEGGFRARFDAMVEETRWLKRQTLPIGVNFLADWFAGTDGETIDDKFYSKAGAYIGLPQGLRCPVDRNTTWNHLDYWGEDAGQRIEMFRPQKVKPNTKPCYDAYDATWQKLKGQLDQDLYLQSFLSNPTMEQRRDSLLILEAELAAIRSKLAQDGARVEVEQDLETSDCEYLWDRYQRATEELSSARSDLNQAVVNESGGLEAYYQREVNRLEAAAKNFKFSYDRCKSKRDSLGSDVDALKKEQARREKELHRKKWALVRDLDAYDMQRQQLVQTFDEQVRKLNEELWACIEKAK